MSASLSAQFLFAALIGMGFPLVRLALGSQAVFLGFAAVCIGSWPLLRHVPEMSGKGLEQQPAEEKQR